MFSDFDKELMHLDYFTIHYFSDDVYILESNCTHHQWKITSLQKNFILEHKYPKQKNFHYQMGCYDLLSALIEITNHDDYQINNRNPRRPNKLNIASILCDKLCDLSMEIGRSTPSEALKNFKKTLDFTMHPE